ncbi:MAG: hypothetical protein ACLSGS_00175 [Adlercreutzia sp.]
MKTSRYRGHVLATITDRALYSGGIGESYQVGQVLIFAAGTKPKPGSEMACADNMAAATEYLDGGDPPPRYRNPLGCRRILHLRRKRPPTAAWRLSSPKRGWLQRRSEDAAAQDAYRRP